MAVPAYAKLNPILDNHFAFVATVDMSSIELYEQVLKSRKDEKLQNLNDLAD